MARRIFVSNSIFRVSKPGFDAAVETDPAKILFDAFGAPAQGAFITGSIAGNNFGSPWSLAATNWMGSQYTTRVTFGRTFPSAPKVFWGVIDPQTGGFMASYQGLTINGTLVLGATTTTTYVEFQGTINGTWPMSGLFTIVYFIFQN